MGMKKRIIKIYLDNNSNQTKLLVEITSKISERGGKIIEVSYGNNEVTINFESIDVNYMVEVITNMSGVTKVI